MKKKRRDPKDQYAKFRKIHRRELSERWSGILTILSRAPHECIAVRAIKGKRGDTLDVRGYFRDETGIWYPTKKGVRFRADEAGIFHEAVHRFLGGGED